MVNIFAPPRINSSAAVKLESIYSCLIRAQFSKIYTLGAFPDGNSALMLVCARLRHVAGTQPGQQEIMKHLEAMERGLLAG